MSISQKKINLTWKKCRFELKYTDHTHNTYIIFKIQFAIRPPNSYFKEIKEENITSSRKKCLHMNIHTDKLLYIITLKLTVFWTSCYSLAEKTSPQWRFPSSILTAQLVGLKAYFYKHDCYDSFTFSAKNPFNEHWTGFLSDSFNHHPINHFLTLSKNKPCNDPKSRRRNDSRFKVLPAHSGSSTKKGLLKLSYLLSSPMAKDKQTANSDPVTAFHYSQRYPFSI